MTQSAWIFARGGSQRVPGKNLALVAGQPLIAWAIQQAKESGAFSRVFVSTDSEEIAHVARQHGADVPFLRPAWLSASNSSELDAWKHAIAWQTDADGQVPAVFVSVPTTAPLRRSEDINGCIELWRSSGADLALTVTPAKTRPGYNMVASGQSKELTLIQLDNTSMRAVSSGTLFDVTTVCYVAAPEYILRSNSLFDGEVVGYLVPEERALDIDTPFDLRVADLVLESRPNDRRDGDA